MSIDDEIAAAWPDLWAKANDNRPGASKRRNNLRRQWRDVRALYQWREANPNASCATCWNCRPYPHKAGEFYCDLDSGGGAYQLTAADDFCIHFHPGAQP